MRERAVGVEEEFLLFDADEPRLVDIGPAVVRSAGADDDAQFEKELKKAQAELATSPHHSLAELATELAERRAELVRSARDRGARLVASGCNPVRGDSTTTDDPRYQQMAARFAATARRQLTCAMHVHVDVTDAEAVPVLNVCVAGCRCSSRCQRTRRTMTDATPVTRATAGSSGASGLPRV